MKIKSPSTGLLVNIIPKIGSPVISVDKIDDEQIYYFQYPTREKLFYTMVDAEKEIFSLNESLNDANDKKVEIENTFRELELKMNNQISDFQNIISDINEIFAFILALVGFILFFSMLFKWLTITFLYMIMSRMGLITLILKFHFIKKKIKISLF